MCDCGTVVVMSRLYKIEDRVAWIPVLTFISLVGGVAACIQMYVGLSLTLCQRSRPGTHRYHMRTLTELFNGSVSRGLRSGAMLRIMSSAGAGPPGRPVRNLGVGGPGFFVQP